MACFLSFKLIGQPCNPSPGKNCPFSYFHIPYMATTGQHKFIFHLFSFVTELFFPDACSLQEDNCLWVIPSRVFPLLRRQPITSRSQNTWTCTIHRLSWCCLDGALWWSLCLGMPYLHTRGWEPTNSGLGMSGSRPHWSSCLTLSHQGTRAPGEHQSHHWLKNPLLITMKFENDLRFSNWALKWPRPDSSRKAVHAHP